MMSTAWLRASVRQIAESVGLSPTRIHQLLADPSAALVEHAMSALRDLGWPAPEAGNHDRALVAEGASFRTPMGP